MYYLYITSIYIVFALFIGGCDVAKLKGPVVSSLSNASTNKAPDSTADSSTTNNSASSTSTGSTPDASGSAQSSPASSQTSGSVSRATSGGSSSSSTTSGSANSTCSSSAAPQHLSPTGKTYYLSPSGNDSNNGLTQATAFQTTSPLHSMVNPGDQVLLEGGQTFSGGFYLGPGSGIQSGTAGKPIFISSYGTGRAIISDGGIFMYNTDNYEISNLQMGGITVYNDDNITHTHVYFDNMDINGGSGMGFNWEGSYTDVSITNSKITGQGYGVYFGSSMANIYFGHNEVSNVTNGAGYGVYYFYANNSVSEYNVIHDIGGGGSKYGAGFATLGAVGGIFQYNEIYNINTGSGQGDDGIIIDACSQNMTFQYNYVHDILSGLGVTLSDWGNNCGTYTGMNIRYNLLVNTGFGLTALGETTETPVEANIYNNTIISYPSQESMSYSFDIGSPGVYNNAFIGINGASIRMSIGPASSVNMKFLDNGYYSPGAPYSFGYSTGTGWNVYSGLAAFRAGTGQEGGTSASVGIEANPLLTNLPSKPPIVGIANINTMPTVLAVYKLPANSPFIGAGMNIQSTLNIDPGKHDFWCNAVSNNIGN